MRHLILVIIMIITLTGHSQSLTIYGGWNKNELFGDGFIGNNPYDVFLKGGEDYSFQVNYKPTASKQSISLLIDHYEGQIKPNGLYLSKDAPDVIFMEKTTLGMGLYPFDIKTLGNLYIQPGADISVLINDKTRFGYTSTFSGTGNGEMTFKDDSLHINNNIQWGVCAIVRYQINIGSYIIAPSYKIYLGGSSELSSNAELVYDAENIFSLRHTFSVGIGRKLKRTINK